MQTRQVKPQIFVKPAQAFIVSKLGHSDRLKKIFSRGLSCRRVKLAKATKVPSWNGWNV